MRLLANENLPGEAVDALRRQGHDVAWIRTDAPGLSDEGVLGWAARDGRLLVTLDKDFGQLAFRVGLPAGCGVLLLRVRASSSAHIARAVVGALGSRDDWAGHFSVVDGDRIRMTPLALDRT
jgi:predicted nuclease of predicted toxin-antitoxin system